MLTSTPNYQYNIIIFERPNHQYSSTIASKRLGNNMMIYKLGSTEKSISLKSACDK